MKREKEDNTKAAASLTIPSPVSLDKFEQWDIPPYEGGKELNFSILYPETANILEVIFLINVKELIIHLGNSIHAKSSFRVKSCMIHLYSGISPDNVWFCGAILSPALRTH